MRRDQVKTPALILDLDVLDSNIATMVATARKFGVALRPHAKSHKSPDIARRLIAAGAVGACCATIGEAEGLTAAGITGLLITSPLTTDDMLGRLGVLLLRRADVKVVADNPRNVAQLATIVAQSGRTLDVIVELDVGIGRTGCVEIADAIALARQVDAEPALRFAGIQAYWGHLQQVMPYEERRKRVEEQAVRLKALVSGLAEIGLKPEIVTGGGTGTHWIDAGLGLFDELQVGSFVFLDSCYGSVPVTGEGNPYSPSLFVAAAVVTANRQDRIIVNAGYKALATDSGRPVPMRGVAQGATYRFMGDEHGAVEFQNDVPVPELGAVIELLTPHCDPTVNLYARYVVVRGDEVVDEWPIVARGY